MKSQLRQKLFWTGKKLQPHRKCVIKTNNRRTTLVCPSDARLCANKNLDCNFSHKSGHLNRLQKIVGPIDQIKVAKNHELCRCCQHSPQKKTQLPKSNYQLLPKLIMVPLPNNFHEDIKYLVTISIEKNVLSPSAVPRFPRTLPM